VFDLKKLIGICSIFI